MSAAEKKTEKKTAWLFLLPAVLSLGGFFVLFFAGGLWERLKWKPNLLAGGELLLLCLLFFALYRFGEAGSGRDEMSCFVQNGTSKGRAHETKRCGSKRRRLCAALAACVVLFDLYLHRMILPFFVSGFYFLFLAMLFCLLTGVGIKAFVWRKEGQAAWRKSLFFSLPFFMVQLNRMNIAVDYDSLRYGLRSQFVLSGNGIAGFFDSLGQVNTVYTYPKGFEVLTLPLAHFRSFSFLLCFQFWTFLACLFAAAALVRKLSKSERCAAQSFLLLAAVCGLSNMAVTAKTDLLTLLFQLLMLLLFLADRPLAASAAAVFTLSLKPTALVFTSAAWLACALVQLAKRGGARAKSGFLRRDGVLLLLACAFTALMWLRTLVITGMPMTSVFTSIWELLGFQAKWPFNFQALPSEGIALGVLGGLLKLAKRSALFLFCPLEADMEHVLMAWGGPMMPLLLCLALRNAWRALRTEKNTEQAQARTLLSAVWLVISLGSLASLYLLWQVDGNYYMLWYALTLVMAFSERSIASERLSRSLCGALFACSLPLALLTGWAGAVGFTPIQFVNRGYYDNLAEMRAWEVENGSAAIWAQLSANPKNRVIAFSDAPTCYYFACNVQSYTDIEGSGGNVRLVKTLNDFKAFLVWADTDYIYFETDYLARGGNARAQSLVHDLIEDGTLTELFVETADLDEGNYAEKPAFCVYGRIDKARAKEPWQVPLSAEAAQRAQEMLALYDGFGLQ